MVYKYKMYFDRKNKKDVCTAKKSLVCVSDPMDEGYWEVNVESPGHCKSCSTKNLEEGDKAECEKVDKIIKAGSVKVKAANIILAGGILVCIFFSF